MTIPVATPTTAGTARTTVPAGTSAGTTTAASQQTATPGFEGILAITGLAALVYLAKRH
jgi:hypothetical protein